MSTSGQNTTLPKYSASTTRTRVGTRLRTRHLVGGVLLLGGALWFTRVRTTQRKSAIHQAALLQQRQTELARTHANHATMTAIEDAAREKRDVATRFTQATLVCRANGSATLHFTVVKAFGAQEQVWLASWRKSVRRSRTGARGQPPSPYSARATELCAALKCIVTRLIQAGYDAREWELSAEPLLIPVPGAVLPPRTPGFYVFAVSKSGRIGAHVGFFLDRSMKIVHVAPGM